VVSGLLAADPVPTPAQALATVAAALAERARHEGYDLTRIVVQAWSEGLRNPPIAELARSFWDAARSRLTELAAARQAAGYLPEAVRPEDAAGTLTLLVPGLVLDHTLLDGAATQAVLRRRSARRVGASLVRNVPLRTPECSGCSMNRTRKGWHLRNRVPAAW
jgi:hypothetical protein